MAAVEISAFHAPYADTGMFGIYAGTDAGDVKELMKVAVEETAAAAGNITEAEVNRAKAQIKVGLLMALESSARVPASSPTRSSSTAGRCRSRKWSPGSKT